MAGTAGDYFYCFRGVGDIFQYLSRQSVCLYVVLARINMSSSKNKKILITGAGGFIGGHLVKYLEKKGYKNIRAVDIKPIEKWHQVPQAAKNIQLDLSKLKNCLQATKNIDEVYNLAADMGGIGFIENHKTACMLNVLINTHLLVAAQKNDVERYFFSSSACVYAKDKQLNPKNPMLKESDAYPAMPEDGYGWEKLFSERMCRHFREDYGLKTRVARFHNVYGPHGSYQGGREKAPAALTRKAIEAKLSSHHQIEIWGDGNQSRTFMYIDDCLKGIDLIMHSQIEQPVNLGSSQLVTVNQLVDIIEEIADIKLKRNYKPSAPQGVRGRTSDNSLIKKHLSWEPIISLEAGMRQLYQWLFTQMKS